MHMTALRKVGGSVMLAVPPAVLDMLHIGAGAQVGVSVERGRLVVDPSPTAYTLEELLSQCDLKAELPSVDYEWLSSSPVGNELI